MDLSQDWDYIEEVAEERLRHNKTFRHVPSYGPSIEVLGAAGELAARKILQMPEQLGTRFDGGIDLISQGITIDVKSTHPRSQWLQLAYYKRVTADILLMMSVNMDLKTAVARGFAWNHEILAAPIDLKQAQACHRIHRSKLHPISKLLTLHHDIRPKALAHS